MLFRVASVKPGESVLIHMAAGGVASLCLQLCQTILRCDKSIGWVHPWERRTHGLEADEVRERFYTIRFVWHNCRHSDADTTLRPYESAPTRPASPSDANEHLVRG